MFIILLFYSFLMALSSRKFVRIAQNASLNHITVYEGFESEIMGQTILISFSYNEILAKSAVFNILGFYPAEKSKSYKCLLP